jgi:lysyl-tRNA synthetase class 2
MTDENEQIILRREKVEELRAQGKEPYVNRYRPTHRIGDARKEYGDSAPELLESKKPALTIAGRVMTVRSHGKTIFSNVKDGTGQIQIYIRKDVAENFEEVRKIDIGDIVAVEGTLFFTRTGELTVRTSRVILLTKSLRPLPEKWHGLKDVETRYRQRYVDLIVNENARETFRKRAQVINSVRAVLDEMDFLEVETPMMQPVPGGATARPFKTHHNALNMDIYLRIAPELYLKRLIVGGFDRVFEINRSFRNEGISTFHNPEFTMLEFYMAYADYLDLMDLTEKMFSRVAVEVCGTTKVTWNKDEIELGGRYERYPFFDALTRIGGIPEDVTKDYGKARQWLADKGIKTDKTEKGAKVLEKLFDYAVEPKLVQPTFIYDYPLALSPLARKKPGNPDLVERFELFIGCREIANAYTELNDPEDQRKRFEEQVNMRESGDTEAHWMDDDYITALEYGMPPTAGEGIGIDRLTMLLTDNESIREVILFPQLKPRPKAE